MLVHFLYRYLFVVSEEAQHMRYAQRSRAAGRRRRVRLQAVAASIAVLFVRSYARAQRIHWAMLARGFTGLLPTRQGFRWQACDFVCLSLTGGYLARGAGGRAASTVSLVDPIIEVRNLHFTYPDGTRALAGIDLKISAGQAVALLGPNGSGKTTFVLHLNGLLRGSGEVLVCGYRVAKENLPKIRQKVGLVFQEPDDQLFMPTLREDVAFGPSNLGLSVEEVDRAVAGALELVGLKGLEKRAPYHLSAGEKRRAGLAGVLAMSPDVLLLDEPTTWLDPPGRASLIELLHPLKQTKVIVTHDLELARLLCTRAGVLPARQNCR